MARSWRTPGTRPRCLLNGSGRRSASLSISRVGAVQTAIDEAAARIREADGLVITAGAGLGVDSGLPDFRGTQGFWRAYPALGRAGIRFEAIASPEAFRAEPRRAWAFYGHRLALYRRTRPHDGFRILRRWAQRRLHGCTVYTSNVDGQFAIAGFEPDRIHEGHGSIHVLQCLTPCGDQLWSADGFEPDVDEDAFRLRGELPRCPRCQGVVRPNVLMFGDGEWIETRAAEQESRQLAWLAGVRRPVVVELGAGTAIPSVRWFGDAVCRRYGASLVRINPRESAVSGAQDVAVPLGSLEALAAIDAALQRLGE